MTADFTFVQINHVACDDCGREFREMFNIYPGMELVVPSLPPGWFQLGRKVLCDKHTITITVDGKEQPKGGIVS
jgi:hypothetical protein